MRVLRTVTIENSAATKNPLAQTSASRPATRQRTSIGASINCVTEKSGNRVIGPSNCNHPMQLPNYQITQLPNSYAFLFEKKCASTKLSISVCETDSTDSNCTPMP